MMRGAAWMIAARWSIRLIGLCNTLILARLLTPEAFGLLALVTSVVAILDALSDFRFESALIRYQDATREEYDAAWTFNLLRGAVLGVIIACSGPVAAYIYGDARLVGLFPVIALISVMQGAANVGTVDFTKHFRLDREFRLTVAKTLLTFFVTVALAVALRNYWALALGAVAGNLIGLCLGYAMHPFRPRFNFTAWRRLLGFSGWLMGVNIMGTAMQNISNLVLGAFIPARGVGVFHVGRELGSMVTAELVGPMSRVLFPGFSKMVGQPDRLALAYQRSVEVLCAIGLPLGIGFALVAREVTLLILGDQWTDAIPVIQAIAVTSAIVLPATGSTAILPALGRARTVFQLSAATLIFTVPITIFLIARLGITGAIIAQVVAGVFWFTLQLAAVGRALSISPVAQILKAWRSVASIAVMSVGVLAAGEFYIGELAIWTSLFIKVFLGAFLYVGCHVLLWLMCHRPSGAEIFLFEHIGRAIIGSLRFRSKRKQHV